MSLPITSVVDVNILIAPKAKALQSFGKLAFVTDELPKLVGLSKLLPYATLESVADEWATTSEVYKAATAFYAQGAKDFVVVIASAVATAAVLQGGTPNLANLQAVDAGGFTISVGGAVQNITGLDFTKIATLADAVPILQAAVTGVTVSVVDDKFVMTTTTIGGNASITVATADIDGAAAALALTSTAGATVVAAKEPETPVEALIAAADIDPTFYGIDLHKKWRDSALAVGVAEYAQGSRRVAFVTSNNTAILDPTSITDIASELKSKSLQRALVHYSSHAEEYPSSAVAGRAFLVNFEGTNTTITLNLKVMRGVTVEKLKVSEDNAMKAKNCNAVVDVAGAFVYSDSRMADGTWFDAVHGVDWLQNRIETGIFNRLYTTTRKIPYTDTGVSIIIAEIEQGLRQGVTNGLISPGNNTAGEYLPLGYRITYIPTAQVSQADKANRVYRGITFEAVGAGAMHQVIVSGEFNE